jgi:putative glutamine amidotransferase
MRPPHGHGHHPPRRPSIGITPDVTAITQDAPLAKYDLKVAYPDAVLRAGGLPFLLPYSDDRAVIEAYLDRISGVVVTGGAFDIPPEAYGESARDGLGVLKPGRTAFESLVIHAALARNMPVLGVCGGMQLLNVALGGTLYQDIGKEMPNARPHEQTHDRTQPAHPIDIKEGTVLADCIGKGQLMVNSTHHQAVKAVGPKLVVTATSPDGVIEAIEAPTHTFAVGVQWHPELLIDSVPPHLGLYKTFVARAREQRR